MTDPAPDAGVGGAEVVVFRRPPAPEYEAREIARQFPGWHVWYSRWAGTWDAHREDEKPYFGPVPSGGRVFMVTARQASGLVALLEDQVRADIAAEFPGWQVRQSPGGWCAICGDGPHSDDGTVVQLVYHPDVGGLLRALQAHCAERPPAACGVRQLGCAPPHSREAVAPGRP